MKLLDLNMTDYAWIETLDDCIDLDMPPELIKIQLKCRPHLQLEKRALGFEYLTFIN